MTNKIIELNQIEVVNVVGGMGFIAGLGLRFGVLATYSIYKTWENGGCVEWGKSGWSSKAMCYGRNAIEDGLFFGVGLNLLGRYLPLPQVVNEAKQK